MLKKILFIIIAVIIIASLWSVLKTFISSPESTSAQLFEKDFLSSISDMVVGPLRTTDVNSPAEVTAEELGELSPVMGMVEIVSDTYTANDDRINFEYIEIRADKNNVQPINISNWSVQSMISDVWIGIPQAAELYVSGEVNELQDIYLRPGERAIIATKQSPVGVSFRVNRCSGFLNDTQDFVPPLSTSCVNPRDIVPPSIENLQEYGASCVAFAENFGTCEYITNKTLGFSNLSQKCLERIQPRLTYNYCSGIHGGDADFYDSKEWRIFLNQDDTIWRETYEIIRLLDENHHTVDVFTY